MDEYRKYLQQVNPFLVTLLVIVIVAPFPYGSNRPWAWMPLEIAAYLLFGGWWVWYLRRKVEITKAANWMKWPLILFLGWIAFGFVQLIPLPPWFLRLINPAGYQLYNYTLGASNGWQSISIDKANTLSVILREGMYVCLFFLTLNLIDTPAKLRITAMVLLVVGASEAALGLALHFLGINIFGSANGYRQGGDVVVRGTFVNRDHYVAHLAMTVSIGLGLFLSTIRNRTTARGWRMRLQHLLDSMLEPRVIILGALALMVGAMFYSLSRAGNASFVAAFGFVMGLALLFKGTSSPDARLAPYVLAIIVGSVLWLGLGGLGNRLLDSRVQNDERFTQWRMTMDLVDDYPVFGIGAGNYSELFPLYRKGTLRTLFYDHAHNDYLELWAEQGIVGLGLLGTGLIIALTRILSAYRRRRDLLMRGILFASLVGTGTLLIHSFFDFNFHIPANALYFFVIMAMGGVAGSLSHEHRRRRRRAGDSVTVQEVGRVNQRYERL